MQNGSFCKFEDLLQLHAHTSCDIKNCRQEMTAPVTYAIA